MEINTKQIVLKKHYLQGRLFTIAALVNALPWNIQKQIQVRLPEIAALRNWIYKSGYSRLLISSI